MAGTAAVATGKKKKTAKSLDPLKTYKIQAADYRNRDGIVIRRSDFDPDTLEANSRNIIYVLFRHAHGALSSAVRV